MLQKNQSLSPVKILIGNKTDVPVSRNSEAVSKEKGGKLAEVLNIIRVILLLLWLIQQYISN